MKKLRIWIVFAAIIATVALSAGHSHAFQASPLKPVYIDPENGFVYFLVRNNGVRTIKSLYGRVFGAGSPYRPGVYLLNNPHSGGLKVSLGPHLPGSVAMYRFMISTDRMDFSDYGLLVMDDSLFYSRH